MIVWLKAQGAGRTGNWWLGGVNGVLDPGVLDPTLSAILIWTCLIVSRSSGVDSLKFAILANFNLAIWIMIRGQFRSLLRLCYWS
jgi:hypothetical protein